MYRVIRGALHHKGIVYRKGEVIPATFANKDGYKHVEQMEKSEIAEHQKKLKSAK